MDPARVRRAPQRASYDWDALEAILGEGKVCHVAIHDGGPVIVPMAYALDGRRLLLHGSTKSRLMQHVASSAPVCIAVTHLDGLVLAKSVFNHSMNYRSAVVFGRGAPVEERAEKLRALQVLTEHLTPGRWTEARQPTAAEMQATLVAAVEVDTFSTKSRTGPPVDRPSDEDLDVWAGVLELEQRWHDPRV